MKPSLEKRPAVRWSLRRPASPSDIDYAKGEAQRRGFKRPFMVLRDYQHGNYTLYLYELRTAAVTQ